MGLKNDDIDNSYEALRVWYISISKGESSVLDLYVCMRTRSIIISARTDSRTYPINYKLRI